MKTEYQKNNKIIRAATYVRVSSDEQVKGYSLTFQKEENIEAIKKDGAMPPEEKHIYIDDGYTGINGNRPALQVMVEAAKRKEFDVIYIWKIDRLFRNTKLVLNLVDDLATYGIGVKSALEPFCDSSNPIGRYMFTMMAAGAEMEHANINERTQHGKIRAMKEGKWLGSAPYGYLVNEETKKLEINESEAKWVKKFFEWFVDEKLTLYQLQQRVNSLNIPTKFDNTGRVKTKNGKCFWARRTLGRILSSELYMGVHTYRKYKNPSRVKNDLDLRPREEWIEISIPSIVGKESFELAQKQLRLNKENSPRRTFRFYMFAKKLRCGVCGGRMHAFYVAPKVRKDGTRKEDYKFYAGSWLTKTSTNQRCENCVGYNENQLEASIWSGITKVLSKPEIMIKKFEKYRKRNSKSVDYALYLEELNKKEVHLKSKEEKLLNTYLEGDLNKELYKKKLSELEQEKIEVSGEIRRINQFILSDEGRLKRIASAKALYKKFSKRLLNEATYEEKCKIIGMLIENITLNGNDAEVEMNLPAKALIPQLNPYFNRPLAGAIMANNGLWDKRRVYRIT